jgi:DME family drug/metabolite transporter
MTVRNESSAPATGLVLIATVLWGTIGPAQALAASPMSAAAVGGWRLLVGGAVLAALAARRPGTARVLRDRAVLRPALVCALATSVYQAAFLASVSRTGAALATVVALGFAPAATGLCARWIGGERVGAGWWAGTGAAVAGCALLMAPGAQHVDPGGVALALIGGTCYGVYTVEAKQIAHAVPSTAAAPAIAAFTLVAGSLVLLPWMIAGAGHLAEPRTLGLIGWLGVVTTAVAYGVFTAGMPRVRATTVGTLSLTEPLVAALLGVLVLHEHLAPTEWAGAALTFAGMLTAALPAARRSPSVRLTGRSAQGRMKFDGSPVQRQAAEQVRAAGQATAD